MRVIILLLVMVMLPIVSFADHQQSSDTAKEITSTVADWSKQQIANYIKDIFKTKGDTQLEANRLSFGITLLQVAYVTVYGWLISFMMPGKIAALIRTTAVMGGLQYIAEYIAGVL